ncbi:uncharacterized protein LOC106166359, partial [Lingula anatina]|uniref:Uncharacterized protein LOC106166359 n=1 Tax=Lingula anatina TaxID=7574 RepID=A0A1S3IQK2_LINAN
MAQKRHSLPDRGSYSVRQIVRPPFRNREDFCNVAVRLWTFQIIPCSVPLPVTRLARARFYYSGEEWARWDDPAVRHRNFYPHCPLVRGTDTGNVLILSTGDPLSNFSILAIVHFENARSTPLDLGGNALSLLASQQALSNALSYSVQPKGLATAVPGKESRVLGAFFEGVLRNRESIAKTGAERYAFGNTIIPTCCICPPFRIFKELARARFFNDVAKTGGTQGILPVGPRHERYDCVNTRFSAFAKWPTPRGLRPEGFTRAWLFNEVAKTGGTQGILPVGPRHERYDCVNTRFSAFANWPTPRGLRPEGFTRAWFFNEGVHSDMQHIAAREDPPSLQQSDENNTSNVHDKAVTLVS